jgi:ribosomal protein S18 acetylase RimI-like enzyme
MDIEPIEDADAEAVVALWDRCGLLRPWNDPRRDIALARGAADADVLVGRLDGTIVAAAMVGFDGHRGWIYYLAVEPGAQRSGRGRAMMAACETWLRARGAPKMMAMVRTTNKAVLGFYEALGFADQETVVMAKWLRE